MRINIWSRTPNNYLYGSWVAKHFTSFPLKLDDFKGMHLTSCIFLRFSEVSRKTIVNVASDLRQVTIMIHNLISVLLRPPFPLKINNVKLYHICIYVLWVRSGSYHMSTCINIWYFVSSSTSIRLIFHILFVTTNNINNSNTLPKTVSIRAEPIKSLRNVTIKCINIDSMAYTKGNSYDRSANLCESRKCLRPGVENGRNGFLLR